MIRLFKCEPMPCTPFDGPQSLARLEREGILLTHRLDRADLLIASRLRYLRFPRLRSPWRKFLIWTDEPRYDRHFTKLRRGLFGLGEIHVMNAYTGDIFLDNFDVLGQTLDRRLPPCTERSFPGFRHWVIAALITRTNYPLVRDGRNIDLFDLRAKIALAGHARQKVHIYGRRWPPGVSREDSRGDGWQRRKEDILQDYHFNLCFENTTIDFYCSEKIWDAIRAGCLPIYFGQGSRIYDDFPRESFIDYCELGSPEALFEFVEQMTVAEFRTRMNRCIDTFNACYEKRRKRTYYDERFSEDLLQRTIDKIRSIVVVGDTRSPRIAA